jgi:hypothetical protein
MAQVEYAGSHTGVVSACLCIHIFELSSGFVVQYMKSFVSSYCRLPAMHDFAVGVRTSLADVTGLQDRSLLPASNKTEGDIAKPSM